MVLLFQWVLNAFYLILNMLRSFHANLGYFRGLLADQPLCMNARGGIVLGFIIMYSREYHVYFASI